MQTEARKLHIIEAVLKTENDDLLRTVEIMFNNTSVAGPNKKSERFADLFGTITNEEAKEMKLTIEDNFEQINPDDWK